MSRPFAIHRKRHTTTPRPAPGDTAIHPLIAGRWSPRAYADRPVGHAEVMSLLEAARWAPSAFNAQPWRFVVFEKAFDRDAFERAFGTLISFNQSWNTQAQVLIAVLADTLTSKGAENPTASYDAGAAAMALLLQASAQGLAAHAMSGLDADAFRAAFAVPARFEVLSMISVAHHGDAQALPDALAERELAPRARLPIGQIAQFGGWVEMG
ncbi:nitroreductase family protein [Caballeronia sp. LZ033]|uniref:nitroreductase family protein n=1 Tax=Caballeronia sp. LZ033 TaxID=3038566 RepID=UPI0028623819|nr:nitroreductase family protein [Caballeronia sp. LZ033]MDR5818794.1 nitroreductase family protein [Caballeronia sp. LZ033]